MISPELRRAHIRSGALTAVALVVAACATVAKPAQLTEAEILYEQLEQGGSPDRVEGAMIRTRAAISSAQEAVRTREAQAYADALAHIALRTAQATRADDERVIAERATDSLRRETLARQLRLSEAQRNQQEQTSQARIDSLRRNNERIQEQADSLRRAAEAANAQLSAALTQLRSLVVEITNLRETSRGIVISLSDILFDVNRATLKPGAEANVRRIAGILQQYPDREIAVEGHTDATGSDAYNQTLSEERAAAVRAALIGGGVPEAQITSRGFGKAQPVATNDTPSGRQQNRRVEIVVLGAGRLADVVPPGTPPSGAEPPPGGAPPPPPPPPHR